MAVDGDADEIEANLKTQGVRIAAKDGHLRAGINFYNNRDDIDRLVAGLVRA
jgi:selenocysteine lyase/cysteine desulfurase